MSELVLYHALFSTCSQKVRFALAFKGLAYESRIVDLSKGEHLEDWYLAINPNGVIPALVHDGAPVADSSVICEYLDETFPERALSPSDAYGRAQMRTWMRYFEEVPTPAVRVPSFNAVFVRDIARRGAEENRRQRDRMPLRKHFYAKLGPDGFPQEMMDEAIERLTACLARVNQALERNGPYLLGDRLTIADVTLMPSIVRMDDLGLADLWSDLPAVAAWYDSISEQPAFGGAYPPGSRLSVPTDDRARSKPGDDARTSAGVAGK